MTAAVARIIDEVEHLTPSARWTRRKRSVPERGEVWQGLAAHRPPHAIGYGFRMSLAQLKDQADRLKPGEQHELIAFLISRQTARDEDSKDALARKIDDKDPAHWVEIDELQKR